MATRADKIKAMTEEISRMQAFMQSAPTDEPTVLVERLSYCNVYLARSGEMLAVAKAMLNEATVAVWEKKGDMLLAAGSQLAQKILAGYCKDEQFLADWLDRVNKGLVHQADNLRTLISYAKENMRTERFADSVRNDTYDRETGEIKEGW